MALTSEAEMDAPLRAVSYSSGIGSFSLRGGFTPQNFHERPLILRQRVATRGLAGCAESPKPVTPGG